jgi:hypothetical protein
MLGWPFARVRRRLVARAGRAYPTPELALRRRANLEKRDLTDAYDPGSGTWHPLGAVLFTKATYSETFKIVNQTETPYEDFSTGEAWTFDWKAGLAARTPPLPQEVIVALGTEFARYSQFWQTSFAPISSSGYKVRRSRACGGPSSLSELPG